MKTKTSLHSYTASSSFQFLRLQTDELNLTCLYTKTYLVSLHKHLGGANEGIQYITATNMPEKILILRFIYIHFSVNPITLTTAKSAIGSICTGRPDKEYTTAWFYKLTNCWTVIKKLPVCSSVNINLKILIRLYKYYM